MFKKSICSCVILTFIVSSLTPHVHAQPAFATATAGGSLLGLPEPGAMVHLSAAYQPAILKGITVHKDNPFMFDFLVDVGQDNLAGESLKNEGDKLIKYFMATLAVPEKDLWVNLSPYEKDRTVPEALGQTDMGRDLLAQDYILKQLTASLIYPEKELGKKFWDNVYQKTQAKYGNVNIPVNTFNKVWIMADKAEVFERNQTAFVTGSHLKVMLEEDYLALQKNKVIPADLHQKTDANQSAGTAQVIREIVLPELEREINTGKNFANLRQIFNSIILASWYKNNLKQSLLNETYSNKSTVKGIDLDDKTIKQQIYERYLQAYKKGVFNYIKETPQGAPKKYFSGGVNSAMASHPTVLRTANPAMLGKLKAKLSRFVVSLSAAKPEASPDSMAAHRNYQDTIFSLITDLDDSSKNEAAIYMLVDKATRWSLGVMMFMLRNDSLTLSETKRVSLALVIKAITIQRPPSADDIFGLSAPIIPTQDAIEKAKVSSDASMLNVKEIQALINGPLKVTVNNKNEIFLKGLNSWGGHTIVSSDGKGGFTVLLSVDWEKNVVNHDGAAATTPNPTFHPVNREKIEAAINLFITDFHKKHRDTYFAESLGFLSPEVRPGELRMDIYRIHITSPFTDPSDAAMTSLQDDLVDYLAALERAKTYKDIVSLQTLYEQEIAKAERFRLKLLQRLSGSKYAGLHSLQLALVKDDPLEVQEQAAIHFGSLGVNPQDAAMQANKMTKFIDEFKGMLATYDVKISVRETAQDIEVHFPKGSFDAAQISELQDLIANMLPSIKFILSEEGVTFIVNKYWSIFLAIIVLPVLAHNMYTQTKADNAKARAEHAANLAEQERIALERESNLRKSAHEVLMMLTFIIDGVDFDQVMLHGKAIINKLKNHPYILEELERMNREVFLNDAKNRKKWDQLYDAMTEIITPLSSVEVPRKDFVGLRNEIAAFLRSNGHSSDVIVQRVQRQYKALTSLMKFDIGPFWNPRAPEFYSYAISMHEMENNGLSDKNKPYFLEIFKKFDLKIVTLGGKEYLVPQQWYRSFGSEMQRMVYLDQKLLLVKLYLRKVFIKLDDSIKDGYTTRINLKDPKFDAAMNGRTNGSSILGTDAAMRAEITYAQFPAMHESVTNFLLEIKVEGRVINLGKMSATNRELAEIIANKFYLTLKNDGKRYVLESGLTQKKYLDGQVLSINTYLRNLEHDLSESMRIKSRAKIDLMRVSMLTPPVDIPIGVINDIPRKRSVDGILTRYIKQMSFQALGFMSHLTHGSLWHQGQIMHWSNQYKAALVSSQPMDVMLKRAKLFQALYLALSQNIAWHMTLIVTESNLTDEQKGNEINEINSLVTAVDEHGYEVISDEIATVIRWQNTSNSSDAAMLGMDSALALSVNVQDNAQVAAFLTENLPLVFTVVGVGFAGYFQWRKSTFNKMSNAYAAALAMYEQNALDQARIKLLQVYVWYTVSESYLSKIDAIIDKSRLSFQQKQEEKKKVRDLKEGVDKSGAQSLRWALEGVRRNRPEITDAAMKVSSTGGIDLKDSSTSTNVRKEGNGVEFVVDRAMIERIRRDGIDSLTPVILRIDPVVNIWPLLGLTPPKRDAERLAST